MTTTGLSKALKRVRRIADQHPVWFTVISTLVIGLIAAYIFYLRYPYAFTEPNFYAEDGTIFVRNVYTDGLIGAIVTRFNGYLITGLYGLISVAMLINRLLGNGFMTMAKSIALTSYLFLGFMCTLPWLLFRKRLGSVIALLTVLMLTIFPLGSADYAVIGTIGNLKFAFFFISALLVLFRNDRRFCTGWKFMAVDTALLICVLTNFMCIVTLPFALIRYQKDLKYIWNKKKLPKLTADHWSLLLLVSIVAAYTVAIYTAGLPDFANYPLAHGPIHAETLLPLLYRGSIFGLLFPIATFPHWFVIIIALVWFAVLACRSKDRLVILVIAATIVINFLGFLLNRPGVTRIFLVDEYSANSIMFFYAGTLLFVFGVGYGIRNWFSRLEFSKKTLFTTGAVIYFLLAFPSAGLGIKSYNIYKALPTLNAEVKTRCLSSESIMHLHVYPDPNLQVVILPRQFVCNSRP